MTRVDVTWAGAQDAFPHPGAVTSTAGLAGSSAVVPSPGYTAVLDEQFTTYDTSKWLKYDNSTFGSPTRVQRYMAANALTGTGASTGATFGTSLRLLTKREVVSGNAFTAGMLDTQSRSYYLPRYGRFEFRAKLPHGQGLWPSFWITARLGGANTAELDIVEYFHSQVPGKNSTTLHGQDNTGTFHANRFTNNVGGRTFFEAPTYTPGWHTWRQEIHPVTDSAGLTIDDVTLPNTNVRFVTYLDDVQVYRFVDTSASYWTTNGGSASSFWNMYLQGCQVDGNFVGHPDGAVAPGDPGYGTLGYSHWTGNCLISGSPPNSCTVTTGGYTVQRAGAAGSTATFSNSDTDAATTTEIDYIRVWQAV